MATGYEVTMYHDIAQINQSLRRIAEALEAISTDLHVISIPEQQGPPADISRKVKP